MSDENKMPHLDKLRKQLADGRMNRREFVRFATLLGIAAPAAMKMAGERYPFFFAMPSGPSSARDCREIAVATREWTASAWRRTAATRSFSETSSASVSASSSIRPPAGAARHVWSRAASASTRPASGSFIRSIVGRGSDIPGCVNP